MNTPTKEDIALANELENGIRFSAAQGNGYCLAKDAAQLIADHVAHLKELAEIGRLAVAIPLTAKDETKSAEDLEDTWTMWGNAVDAYIAKR